MYVTIYFLDEKVESRYIAERHQVICKDGLLAIYGGSGVYKERGEAETFNMSVIRSWRITEEELESKHG